MCDHEEKARGQNPSVGPGLTIFKLLLVFCRMKIEQNEKRTKQEVKQKRKNHLRDGLPAEGYEGAREGHIFP